MRIALRPTLRPTLCLPLVALVPFFSATATAQEPAPADQPAEPAPDTLDRKRLLTLADGRILRVRSRLEAGVWQMRAGPQWVPVDGEVAVVRLERDVLAEAGKMGSALGRRDTSRRVSYAQWLVQQGLHPEAILQLDRVLREDPENPAALRTIRENPIALDLPQEAREGRAAELSAILRAGAGGSPATREVAVMRLAEFAPYTDLEQLVAHELNVPQNRRRAFAALTARRLFKGKLLQGLASRAMLDTFSDVRAEAARSLGAADDVAVLAPAINSLSSKFPSVRANAAEAMGNMGYKAAVEPLVNHLAALQAGSGPTGTRANLYLGLQTAYVADFDVEIAQGSSIADPIVGVQASGVVFDVRSTVQMTKVIEMRATMSALRSLTGAKVQNSANAWAAWWEKNGEEWRSAKLVALERRVPETLR